MHDVFNKILHVNTKELMSPSSLYKDHADNGYAYQELKL